MLEMLNRLFGQDAVEVIDTLARVWNLVLIRATDGKPLVTVGTLSGGIVLLGLGYIAAGVISRWIANKLLSSFGLSKSGVAPHEARNLASVIAAMPRLRLRGLMAIPEPGAPRSRYQEVKKAFDSLKDEFAFDTLSMGMSDDLDLALEEGATMVRIGTSIFGPRLNQQSAA